MYQDFRKMLDEMDEQIDAVIVGTPDLRTRWPRWPLMKRIKRRLCEAIGSFGRRGPGLRFFLASASVATSLTPSA